MGQVLPVIPSRPPRPAAFFPRSYMRNRVRSTPSASKLVYVYRSPGDSSILMIPASCEGAGEAVSFSRLIDVARFGTVNYILNVGSGRAALARDREQIPENLRAFFHPARCRQLLIARRNGLSADDRSAVFAPCLGGFDELPDGSPIPQKHQFSTGLTARGSCAAFRMEIE